MKKLKDKLGDEALENYEFSCYCENDFLSGYELGFEKAREMAAELLKNSLSNPRYRDRDFTTALNLIVEDLLQLGEEEVE
jgi:hypothetical protein